VLSEVRRQAIKFKQPVIFRARGNAARYE